MSVVVITKADGTQEPFRPEKLDNSLKRAGARQEIRKEIVSAIGDKITPGMSTQEIYARAFSMLRKRADIPVAARYSLRRALQAFGPTGFPFEAFVAELYRADGYKAEVGVIAQGKCMEHELDVVAVKGRARLGAELKFHNRPGFKTDVKTALYVHARFEDLHQGTIEKQITKRMLITNTKFTSNAIRYSECVGLTLMGWNYPEKENLQDLIAKSGLHPITCLTTISGTDKEKLLSRGIVLCRDVKQSPERLARLGFSKQKIKRITEESAYLCQAPKSR